MMSPPPTATVRGRSSRRYWSKHDNGEETNHSTSSPQVVRAAGSGSTSGGGLIPTLVGVVSWGMGCGRPTYAGVYADIRVYRKWIIEKIGGEPNHLWTV
jgi:secreted trypsin-like serine protease